MSDQRSNVASYNHCILSSKNKNRDQTTLNHETKLQNVLSKILDNTYAFSDDTILNKLRLHLSDYLHEVEPAPVVDGLLLPWLARVVQGWNGLQKSARLFALQVCAVIAARSAAGLDGLLRRDVLSAFSLLVRLDDGDTSCALSYAGMLAEVVKYDVGALWFINSDVWQPMVVLYRSNRSLYVHLKARELLVSAAATLQNLNAAKFRTLLEFVLQPLATAGVKSDPVSRKEMFEPVRRFLRCGSGSSLSFLSEESKVVDVATVELLYGIVKTTDHRTRGGLDPFVGHDVEMWCWRRLMRENVNEELFGCLSSLIAHLNYTSPRGTETDNEILEGMICLIELVVSKKQFSLANTILMRSFESASSGYANLDANSKKVNSRLFALYMVPLVAFLKLTTGEEAKNKVETSLSTFTGAHLEARQYLEVACRLGEIEFSQLVRSTVQNVTKVLEYIEKEKARLVFETLVSVLDVFCKNSLPGRNGFYSETLVSTLIANHPNFLIDVFDAIDGMTADRNIVDIDSVTGTRVLRTLEELFQAADSIAVFKTKMLGLICSIIKCVAPSSTPHKNICYVSEHIGGLGLMLLKNLGNPHWEIRDSVIEILQSTTLQAETSFPTLLDFILKPPDFPSAVYAVALHDEGQYVRASAIVCLRKMARIDRVWTRCLSDKQLIERMLECLREDTEGIVRKEAAHLIAEIYRVYGIGYPLLEVVYRQLMSSAVSDFHWEVKVNALLFWEMAIQNTCVENGMVDGAFPVERPLLPATVEGGCGKTKVKSTLDKILERLSETGCLQVLWSTLNDDCDLEVVRKSASIISNLLAILKWHGLIEEASRDARNLNERVSVDVEQANTLDDVHRKSRVEPSYQTQFADDVIQAIVDSGDLELLSSVGCTAKGEEQPAENSGAASFADKVSVADFLAKVAAVNLEEFVRAKKDWIVSADAMEKLMDVVLAVCPADGVDGQINAIDCY